MFTLGLCKRAALDRHNDGTEFKISDTDPAPYAAGAGGVAPSGIPMYQPSEDKSKPLSGKAGEKKQALLIATMGKAASVDPRELNLAGDTGDRAQTTDTTVSQLKYETSTPQSDRVNLPEGKKRMGFHKGFHKKAGKAEAIGEAAKSIVTGVSTVGKGIGSGVSSSMGHSVGDTLQLKGLGHLADAYKEHGIHGLKTPAGQEAWGKAIGKSAPSLAAGAGYTAAAKKVYDKVTEGSPNQQMYYY